MLQSCKKGEVIGTSITITGCQSMLSDLMSNPSDINPMNEVTTSSNNITSISGDNNNDAANIATKKAVIRKGLQNQCYFEGISYNGSHFI